MNVCRLQGAYKATVKNKYPVPLVQNLMDRLSNAGSQNLILGQVIGGLG